MIKGVPLPRHNGEVRSKPSPKVDLGGLAIHQLLFSPDSRLLLITSESCGHICDVEGVVMASATFVKDGPRQWLNHPIQKDLFLGFGGNDVRVFSWADLKEQRCLRFRKEGQYCSRRKSLGDREPIGKSEQLALATTALFTQDGQHVLLQIKDSPRARPTTRLIVFKIPAFMARGEEESLTCHDIPQDIVATVEKPLGILSGPVFAFIDQDMWLCTFPLGFGSPDVALTRHYFIPRDWVNSDTLEQCHLLDDGTLLLPRNDRVVIIRSRHLTS